MNLQVVLVSALLAITGWLAGCEGVITGTEVARVPLQTGADGAYTPVRFNLAPDMNAVAVNFRADFSQNPTEFGKYNTYRATLSKDGSVAAMRTININHPVANPQGSASPPTQTVYTLFYVDVQSAGEYELTITPVKPVEISLSNAQVDARRNVRRPPQ
jgi:hypothetical protein